MIIGVDGNEANVENRVGINQYAAELLVYLEKLPASKKHKFIIYLKESPLDHLPKEREGWKYKVLVGSSMWILKMLMPHLWLTKERPDVFFSPNHYTPPFLPIPTVISVMDLGYLKSREQFKKYDFLQLKYWGAMSLKSANKIIAISESTKREITTSYKWTKNKVEVTLLGYDKKRFNEKVSKSAISNVRLKYKIVGDYVLFLSTLKPSKNIEGLIQAFSIIKNSKLTLVIAGKKGWNLETIYEKVTKLGMENKVVFTDFIPEDDKPALISGASVFALASYWEGFGIPVLEAMACGVPVVVSDIGSLPEVVGSAGVYVDPANPQSIADAIDTAFAERSSLSKKSLIQARKFDWEVTARRTLEILQSAKGDKSI